MIRKEMKIEDVLRNFPGTAEVFQQFGIDCTDCQLSQFEDLEHGAKVHNIDLDELLRRLNETLTA